MINLCVNRKKRTENNPIESFWVIQKPTMHLSNRNLCSFCIIKAEYSCAYARKCNTAVELVTFRKMGSLIQTFIILTYSRSFLNAKSNADLYADRRLAILLDRTRVQDGWNGKRNAWTNYPSDGPTVCIMDFAGSANPGVILAQVVAVSVRRRDTLHYSPPLTSKLAILYCTANKAQTEKLV